MGTVKNRCRVAVLSLVVVLLVCGCGSLGRKARLTALLNIDVFQSAELCSYDSHGGFHGDGVLCYGLQFPDHGAVKEIEENPHWKPLPLEREMEQLLYGMKDDTQENTLLPAISNGYYFFYDRHAESKDPYDDTDVFQRHSFNMTVAIYDTDSDTLYYIELDT